MRRKPNVITIPVGDPPELDEAESELAYEEQPVASSNLRIGSTYGYRRDPFTRRARFHSGLDIKARWGQPVGASHPGIVQFAGWYYGYGNLLIVDHGGGVTTYYAHLASFELGVGDKVTRGAIVGYAGSTGRATSPHLHYEVRFEGNSVDPLQPLALDPSSGYFSRDDAPSARTSQDEKK
jgi:murein DD-endopeptidase MepM/ murein hydrolase activator NlpD